MDTNRRVRAASPRTCSPCLAFTPPGGVESSPPVLKCSCLAQIVFDDGHELARPHRLAPSVFDGGHEFAERCPAWRSLRQAESNRARPFEVLMPRSDRVRRWTRTCARHRLAESTFDGGHGFSRPQSSRPQPCSTVDTELRDRAASPMRVRRWTRTCGAQPCLARRDRPPKARSWGRGARRDCIAPRVATRDPE